MRFSGNFLRPASPVILVVLLLWAPQVFGGGAVPTFPETLRALAASADRSTGAPGSAAAAEYIRARFQGMGTGTVGSHRFLLPVRTGAGTLTVVDRDRSVPLHPFVGNAVSPGTIPPEGFEGPLVYGGAGGPGDLDGKPVSGGVVLLTMDSGKNWTHAADLGARAVIYLDPGGTPNPFFREKHELTPVPFPRFWMDRSAAEELLGPAETAESPPRVRLTCDAAWRQVAAENIYCLIPGTDPDLKGELIIAEAFYDSTAWVAGRSPGADEACGAATLLRLGDALAADPPGRSVLLVATAGHAQSLAGMREMIWSIRTPSDRIAEILGGLESSMAESEARSAVLARLDRSDLSTSMAADPGPVKAALEDRIKTEVDAISRRLMRLRLESDPAKNQDAIRALAGERLLLRRLMWRTDYGDLSPAEVRALGDLIPLAVGDHQRVLRDAEGQHKELKSAKAFRSLVKEHDLAAVISLHLSSRGEGIGAFNRGWLYDLKPEINRVAAYSRIDDVLRGIAADDRGEIPFHDTLRPSRRRPWRSYLPDHPFLGGEVSALAGYLGLTLATVHDARPRWGTPHDTLDGVDMAYAQNQCRRVVRLIRDLSRAPRLEGPESMRNGFATVTGRANLLRHGELFPDQPAADAVILAFQGPGTHHARVDPRGIFRLKGMATKKMTLHKVILEGYRFNPETGRAEWAVDKPGTGKSAYRVKMNRREMETDLIFFACRGITLFNLLEPRTFRYMTKIQILDGRREAAPLRYWYSRIDTRESTLCSVYLEPGARLKLTLSDSVLEKKMILTHAEDGRPNGTGYAVDQWRFLHHTAFRAARDMWALLAPRIANLEAKGIFDERIRRLQEEGVGALSAAREALDQGRYGRHREAAQRSWALAARVYSRVESTQKDVLFGVLFYVALFVPFAFCAERLLFGFTGIHGRILAFLGILLILIAVIYQVHPAFELAYSPLVVILAFFIMGLSLLVTLIIFFRFESEMVRLQQHAKQMKSQEISPWRAFISAFFLGVSNLRRRRVRTALTCATLVILTFTIMSFTTVKSVRRHVRLAFQDDAPYTGFLLKNPNWGDLPPETLDAVETIFGSEGEVLPRVWLEGRDRTRGTRTPVRHQGRTFEALGVMGLSPAEPKGTGLERVLTAGRWFPPGEDRAVLLSARAAAHLGIPPDAAGEAMVDLWGTPHRVAGIFSGEALLSAADLDDEPLTPAIFPSETATQMTEAEAEALESGEEIQAFQSRYHHIEPGLTLIVPARPLLAGGGRLKGISIRPGPETEIRTAATRLADRIGLILFCGEPGGTFLYNAADTLNYSGVPNIAIPIAISVFIVLNTMIGSVYERRREIGIYTSVGLAPSHVSFLFIAEALAFGVLSVVAGYLLAQVTATLFSQTALWAGITVNYSSLAGVAAMVLVILVVLVSAVYPSRVAAEIAIPDVNRAWRLPPPRGNRLEATLPFLMKSAERDAMAGFLLDYFEGHRDVSHGRFSTGEVRAGREEPGPEAEAVRAGEACTTLHAQVWLAPFDFGIMQRVDLRFCPAAENPGFLEIHAILTRLAGERNAWARINRAFLHAVRKQLLLWRSLDETARREYAGRRPA